VVEVIIIFDTFSYSLQTETLLVDRSLCQSKD
jgi:hypothetical protein